LILAALSACGGGNPGTGSPAQPESRIRVAPNPGDQWTLVPAADAGMDPALLASAVSTLPGEQVHGLSSMLVTRRGKPVLEHYWNGYDKDTLHDLRSATKSITSLMMGVAIDRHLVGAVGDTLNSHLGTRYPNAPAYRLDLTLGDMLTMRSGLDCDDWQSGSPGNETKMYGQTDWVKFYTSLQAVAAPGSIARYCTGNPVALGQVIATATRQAIPAFADQVLFGPMNIQSAKWAQFDNGSQTDTGGHIQMRPRDMIKLGQLVLQQGQWNGQQLVSAAWVAESTRQHTQFNTLARRNGYGYLWWRSVEIVNGKSYEMIFADGNGGQLILVVPALELVAVFTGENYNSSKAELPFEIMDNYILAAAK
jgi:CubicO group peptidase (beta-lactamase class C family)